MAVFNKAILAVVLISAVFAEEIPKLSGGRGFYLDSDSRSVHYVHSESALSDGSQVSMSSSELETSLSYGDVYGHNSKTDEVPDISISWSADVPNYKPHKCPELAECKKQFKSVHKMIDLLQDEKESTMRLIKTKLYKSKDLEEDIASFKQKNHNVNNKIKMQLNKLKSQELSLNAQKEMIHEIKESYDKMRELVHNQAEKCEKALKGIKLEEGPFGTYHFFNDDKNVKNWHEARDYCRERNMHLATANTAAENIWLTSRVREILDAESSSHDVTENYWFGLNNLGRHSYLNFNTYDTKHHTWFWYAIGAESKYFTWATNEPSDKMYQSSEADFDSESTSNEFYNQQCVSMGPDGQEVKWFDNDCYDKFRFVCELDEPCPLRKYIAHEHDSSGSSMVWSLSQETLEHSHGSW